MAVFIAVGVLRRPSLSRGVEKELLAYNADLVIADEAHKLKENRSKQSQGMSQRVKQLRKERGAEWRKEK